jgi:phosphopantothenoylcysteine decarboxylase/phosphopantothenate--cysteine ligase
LKWAEVVILAPVSEAVLSVFGRGAALQLLQQSGVPVIVVPARIPGAAATDFPWVSSLPGGGTLLEPEDNERLQLGALGEIAIAPVATVAEFAARHFTRQILTGKHLMLTAGPTIEDIDPVRFITNRSSGKMGLALALAAQAAGAEVSMIHGPLNIALPRVPGLKYLPVRSAAEMHEAASKLWGSSDIAILAAAVADFTPDHYAPSKIKKRSGQGLALNLIRTTDILAEIGNLGRKPFLVGFAAESDDVAINALVKLRKKHCDMLCANDIREAGAGFAVDTNHITIYDCDGGTMPLPMLSKREAARRIITEIARRLK